MQSWNDFYFMCGSSAAGLTGLMFVAVTFGSRLITEDKLAYADAFFGPIAFHFVHVFVLCCVALMPSAGPIALGVTIAVSTIVRVVQLSHTIRMTRAAAAESLDIETSDWVLGVILPALVYAALLVAAVLYFRSSPAAPTALAISIVALLIVALRRAWEMLLWIATKID